MNFQDCIRFANQNPLVYFATVDRNQPRVRPIKMWFANEQGFYFQTEMAKAFYQQLNVNKRVEICFYASEAHKVMRVAGEVEFINDLELKARVLQDRPLLKGLGIEKAEDPLLVVFRIYKGEAFFWTRENTMKESNIDRIKFGGTY